MTRLTPPPHSCGQPRTTPQRLLQLQHLSSTATLDGGLNSRKLYPLNISKLSEHPY